MQNQLDRCALVMGEEKLNKLSTSRVAVFGVGGVGGYVVEALARMGVGTLALIDGDTVSLTNINRQIIALHSTVGQYKVTVAKERIKQIDPHICVNEHIFYYNEETKTEIDLSTYDYVVDAIDTVSSKIILATECERLGVPLIACMGTGNKFNPMAFKVADIYATKVCPLAKVMRRELKRRGVKALKVVYSEEEPQTFTVEEGGRHAPGSVSFVPPAAAMLVAAEVVKDLCAGTSRGEGNRNG